MGRHEFATHIVVITGASSGIGEATAQMFGRCDARVAIFARSAEKLNAIAEKFPEKMIAVTGDVANPHDIERLFAETESRFGPCSILINNAGMIDPKPLTETSLGEWERMFAVNVHGTYLATRRALPAMIEKRRGAIVNVASISGVPGPEKFPGWVSYCASKAAVIGMTEALAVEVKEHGVRVNSISPGSVDTKMWAEASGGAPAAMTPHDIAFKIGFLAGFQSHPMNGQNLNVWSA